jgi:hypothetical protein
MLALSVRSATWLLGAAAAVLLALIATFGSTDRAAHSSLHFMKRIAGCLPAPGGNALLQRTTFRIHAEVASWVPATVQPARADPPFYDLSMRDFVLYLAHHLTRGTPSRFSEVRINELPTSGALNIYFVDCTLEMPAGPFDRGSCLYVGHFDSIICRSAYFTELFDRYDRLDRVFDLGIQHIGHGFRLGLASQNLQKGTTAALKRDLVSWIIGHEISHAILHREIFRASETPLHFDYQYNAQEEEADHHFAQQIGNSAALARLGMSVTLNEVIHREYRSIAERTIPAMTQDDLNTAFLPTIVPIVVPVAVYDYPLIVRAIRVQDAIIKEGHEFDRSGYLEAVRANLQMIESHTNKVVSREAGLAIVLAAIALSALIFLRRDVWFD